VRRHDGVGRGHGDGRIRDGRVLRQVGVVHLRVMMVMMGVIVGVVVVERWVGEIVRVRRLVGLLLLLVVVVVSVVVVVVVVVVVTVVRVKSGGEGRRQRRRGLTESGIAGAAPLEGWRVWREAGGGATAGGRRRWWRRMRVVVVVVRMDGGKVKAGSGGEGGLRGYVTTVVE